MTLLSFSEELLSFVGFTLGSWEDILLFLIFFAVPLLYFLWNLRYISAGVVQVAALLRELSRALFNNNQSAQLPLKLDTSISVKPRKRCHLFFDRDSEKAFTAHRQGHLVVVQFAQSNYQVVTRAKLIQRHWAKIKPPNQPLFFGTIFENAPYPAVLFDFQRKLVHANAAARVHPQNLRSVADSDSDDEKLPAYQNAYGYDHIKNNFRLHFGDFYGNFVPIQQAFVNFDLVVYSSFDEGLLSIYEIQFFIQLFAGFRNYSLIQEHEIRYLDLFQLLFLKKFPELEQIAQDQGLISHYSLLTFREKLMYTSLVVDLEEENYGQVLFNLLSYFYKLIGGHQGQLVIIVVS